MPSPVPGTEDAETLPSRSPFLEGKCRHGPLDTPNPSDKMHPTLSSSSPSGRPIPLPGPPLPMAKAQTRTGKVGLMGVEKCRRGAQERETLPGLGGGQNGGAL